MGTAQYLVTGGAGFIGHHIVQMLLDSGRTVRILDNLTTGSKVNVSALRGQVEFIHGDLRDLEIVRTAVNGVEVVFHQAAMVSVPRSIADPQMTLEVNVMGTQHVLLAARDAGVRRVVYASSSSVYGDTPALPKREDMPAQPMSPYALHKLTGESLCSMFTHLYGLETVSLRYFNVFGPHQNPLSEYAAVIPRFLHALSQKQRPIVYGDGEQTRDFTYVSNVVQANLLAATAESASGRAINIGCGEQISLNKLLHLASEMIGVTIQPEYRSPRPGDVRDSLADISLALELLNYKPTIHFQEGLALTFNAWDW